MLHEELCERIIGAAIEVHRQLGPGLLESAYRACLTHELRERGETVRVEVPMPVEYCSCKLRLCRESKLESPLSALRSSQSCATGVLPWPRPPVPALSMDLEN